MGRSVPTSPLCTGFSQMQFSLKALIVLLILGGNVHAHEHWLFTETDQYQPGDTVSIHIRSGHAGGSSEFLIATKLIQEALLVGPDGTQTELDFNPIDMEHIASIHVQTPGSYTVLVNLRKRSKGPFTYLLKTGFQVGSESTELVDTPVQELEIAFGEAENTLKVFSHGEAVIVPISLMSGSHEGRSLTMDRSGVSRFTPEQSGLQVAICHFRRQTASYSFYMDK